MRVPWRRTRTEAIELGKRYSTSNSGAFINGILDKIKNRADTDRASPDAEATVPPAPIAPEAEEDAD